MKEGVLDPLVLMARSDDIDIQREVAAALNNLSSVDENKVEIADRAISTIITLAVSSEDVEVEKQAVCTIANLVEMVELHDKLLEEHGLMPLIALSAADDVGTKGEACRALANLAANRDMQVRTFLYILEPSMEENFLFFIFLHAYLIDLFLVSPITSLSHVSYCYIFAWMHVS